MLQALELENFKAFGERARIQFAPITLIFGENSAGKSTILQALNLLKQTLESREAEALLLPRAENGIVDLGSFQELLFDHDLKRALSIRVKLSIDKTDMVRSLSGKNKIAIEFRFKRPSIEEEVLLDQIGIYNKESCIAQFQPLPETEYPETVPINHSFFHNPLFRISRGFRYSKISQVQRCVWLTEKLEDWQPEFKSCREHKEDILKQLKETLRDYANSNEELQEDNSRLQEERNDLKKDIEFLSSDFDLEAYISKRHKEEMNTVLGLQGFLPIVSGSTKGNRWRTGFRSLSLRRFYDKVNVGSFATAAGSALEQTLTNLFPMGPFRRAPERWYIFTGTSPQDVGYQGDLLPDLLFRRSNLVKEANKWLKHLDIGYKLEVKPVGTNSGDLFEVRLIDTRRKGHVDASLPDVGFGISQLLPFIVQSLVSEEQIISIEQPEVHVHPRLQADLGELLAEAIKPPRCNRFIIETHSEHLILRLQRLVAEKQIAPEDISVIYVSRGHEGAKAERLRLDEEGDFIDEWPNGFFPERLRELR